MTTPASGRAARRTALAAWPALLAVLALPGCARDVAGPAWLREAPAPVRLSLTLDTARAVSEVVGPAGASLTAAGEDGTFFTLELPKGALDRSVRITVTPVRAVKGRPLEGRTAAAVQLAPDGLQLLQPATLTIEPAREVPVAEQVAFGYFGEGEDAHLYPLTRDPGRIEFRLVHFSGYGVGYMPPGDPGREALQRATREEARLAGQLGALIGAERVRQLVGTEEEKENGSVETARTIARVYSEYIESALLPLCRAAADDYRLAKCAMERYLSTVRALLLLGIVDEEQAGSGAMPGYGPPPEAAPTVSEDGLTESGSRSLLEAQRLLDAAMRNAERIMLRRAVDRCRVHHEFEAVNEVVAMMRQHALLGDEAMDAELERAWKDVVDCLNFEVEFDSRFENRAPHGVGMTYEVRSRVRLSGLPRMMTGDTIIPGAALEYVHFSAYGNPAAALWGDGGGSSDEQRLGRGMAMALGSGAMSPAGTRAGTLSVLGLERHVKEDSVIVTDCRGEDAKERQVARDSFTVTLRIDKPTEIVRMQPARGPAFTTEDHSWASHWESSRHKDALPGEALAGGEGDDEDDEAPLFTRLLLVPTGVPGEWHAEFTRNDAASGWSLAERSRVRLRHAPR